MSSDAVSALRDPTVQDRLNELSALGLPVVEFFAFGKYVFVTASGRINDVTVRVAADSPVASYRSAMHQACANARTMLRAIEYSSEGGRDVAQVAHTLPTVAANREGGATPVAT